MIKLVAVQSVWGWFEVGVMQVGSGVLVSTGGRRGFDWVYIYVTVGIVFTYSLYWLPWSKSFSLLPETNHDFLQALR